MALQFYDSTGANVGGGATTTSGADVGEFTTSLAYDNTQTDEPLPAGDYTATFYFCQGECGSSHPISKILGSASTTFTIADAGGVPPVVHAQLSRERTTRQRDLGAHTRMRAQSIQQPNGV